MKKITFLIAITLFISANVTAQAAKQLNFGLVGISYEIPVTNAITIAPTAFTNWDLENFIIGVKGNYYFDELIELPSDWDVYGGLNAGYAFHGNNNENGNDDFNLGLHAGGRWFWSETWGVYVEAGGGNLGGQGAVGITMKL